MAVSPIPAGYHTVTPYLIVKGAAAALDFYQKALGAEEVMRLEGPGGTIGHAEFKIGDSMIMLADECPEMSFRGPKSIGGTPVSLHVYVDKVDARFELAIAHGGKVIRPVQDQFYGDRTGLFEDPFGHVWCLATHTEDLSPEEIGRRAEEYMKSRTK